MGLLSSVGIGIGAAANAAQPFIMNMQQAEIQKLKDDRMAEIAKNTAKWSADYADKLSGEREQKNYDLKVDRESAETAREVAKKGLLNAQEDQRRNDPAYLKGVAAEAGARHIEPVDRGAALRAIQLESAQLTLEEQKAANKFTPGEKEALSGLRKSSEIIEAAIAKVDAEGGTASQSSLDKLAKLTESRMKLLEPHLPKTEAPPAKPEPTVKYDAQGRAWVKGADGKPVLQSEADAAKPKAGAAAGTIGERPDVPAVQAKYPSTLAGAAQAKADEATRKKKESDASEAKQSVAQFTAKLDKGIGDAGLAAFALQVEEKHPGTLTPWQLRQAKNLTTKTGAR